eukprot:3338710-Pyramimonas_sp.AAC.1
MGKRHTAQAQERTPRAAARAPTAPPHWGVAGLLQRRGRQGLVHRAARRAGGQRRPRERRQVSRGQEHRQARRLRRLGGFK